MDSNVVHGDIKRISDFDNKMKKNSRSIQNLANESLDKIYKIRNELYERINSLTEEEESLEEELDAAYMALQYAQEANSNSENPQPIPDYYYTRIDTISKRLSEARRELTQLEKINDEFQESIKMPLKKVEDATSICVDKIGRGSNFISKYIQKLEELKKATIGHSGADGTSTFSADVDNVSSVSSSDVLDELAIATGSSLAVEQMLSELGSQRDIVDYDTKESVSNLLAEFNITDDEPSTSKDLDVTDDNTDINNDSINSGNGGTPSATSNSGPAGTNSSVSSGVAPSGVLTSNFTDVKFLTLKTILGNFECKDELDNIEQFGVTSFGCDSKAADDWGTTNYTDWMNRNQFIEDDIRFYTGTGHSAIRGYLDGTGNYGSEVARIERNLHSGLQDASLPNDMIMYRAISADALNKMIKEAGDSGTLGSGFILHDKSYLSCSAVANNSFNISRSNKVIFRIAAQKGQHAAYVNNWSSVPINEYEMLVDKDSYIYVHNCYYAPRRAVTGTGTDDDIVLIVDGELIQK